MSLARLGSAIRSMVTRAKVVQSGVGPRVVVQVQGLDKEEWTVELLVGPRPEDQVRAVVALGGLQDCAVLFPDEYADDALRTAAVDAALRALLVPA